LVAAAGNQGRSNDRVCDPLNWGAMYPAAYNWVLGVMAQAPVANGQGDWLAGFSNYDCLPGDTVEYELMAPGVDILSTLPGDRYAAWDGTSMAAPIASGIAALVRTRFPDKQVYSSRFVMGQVASTGGFVQARHQGDTPVSYRSADALAALTATPKPSLGYLEHWLFDTKTQAAGNNGNGRIDAGETVDLAIVIKNRWGNASDVNVKLEAQAEAAQGADPCVSFSQNTVNYGAVGAFATDDNGLIRDAQGAIIGVANPFRFTVSATCPNDHVIPFKLTMTARNGLDPNDAASYTTTGRFYLIVQRGRELPRLIDQDMTLTKEDYWLVPDGTLVNPGVTLTVTEGTQVQFFTSDSASPYARVGKAQIQVEGNLRVRGTADEPVQIFPSPLFPTRPIQVRAVNEGDVIFEYAEITNPIFRSQDIYSYNNSYVPLKLFDHTRLYQWSTDCIGYYVESATPYWNACGDIGSIYAEGILKSAIIGLGSPEFYSYVRFTEGSLFDSTSLVNINRDLYSGMSWFMRTNITDTVFLRGHKIRPSKFYTQSWHLPSFLRTGIPINFGGRTYVGLSPNSYNLGLGGIEQFARTLGGHVMTVRSEAEDAYIYTYRDAFSQGAFEAAYPGLDCGSPNYGGPSSCGAIFGGPTTPVLPYIIGLEDIDESGNLKWTSGEITTYNGLIKPLRKSDGVHTWGYNSGWNSFPKDSIPNIPSMLEFPLGTTPTQLLAARQSFLESDSWRLIKNNAFLNDWNDPAMYHWMRFFVTKSDICNTCREHVGYLSHNYWGTTSTQLIDAAIHDFNDDFNLGMIEYQPILTTAPETAYPFMVNAEVRNASGAVTGKVGAEPITLTVTFNRDMDVAKQPAVSFGPAEPYTDYVVPGQWMDARTWKGQYSITPVTGDGMQSIRVAGAVAADDPWLVTGNDYGRFRFEIITSGAEAMTLQAKGRAGGVDLSWMQDDFDLLAGYHLYRSPTENGSYNRINATLIPAGQTSYADNAVEPGVTYFYKFTVVKTDFSESGFSNVASGTPLDSIAPVITHTPITSARPGISITIAADITDNIAVKGATLYFRKQGTSAWTSRAMTHGTDNRWSASLEGSLITMPGLDYYLQATDGFNTARSGQADFPHRIAVEDKPTITSISPVSGPAAGGTRVSLLGVNFKPGATATLGGAACTTPTRVSATELTCTTPPHIPDTVDVKVINPDQASGVLLRGFTYQGATVTLGLPDSRGGQNTQVEVPINLANVAGLASASLTIGFDPAVLRVESVAPGNLAPGWTLTANTGTPGQVALAMSSGGSPVTGSGTLVVLTFKVLGAPGSSSTMTPASVRLNDGAIPTNAAPGTFSVETVYQVTGATTFWNAARP
ncbi:MAG: IPT/TIG domain-containing protein, partial [Methylococcus sp.]